MSDVQENNEPSTRSVTVSDGEPGGSSEWAEFRAQMHEWRETVERRLPPWWNRALAGALIVLGILVPFFFSADSGFLSATVTAVAYAVMALGLNIVVGFAGLLDLGYVAFYALGAYSWGWFASGFFYKAHVHVLVSPVASTLPGIHLNVILVLAAAALICALAGMLIGLPTLRLRGDYIAIVTLAFGEIIGVVAVNGTSIHLGGGMTLTAGNLGISGVDSPYFPGVGLFSELNLRPWYWLIFGVLLLVLFVNLRLRDSRLGRAWEVRWVHGADPEVARGQRHATADRDARAVDGDRGDDLPERERDDRDVVAAQAQRRQADQHPRRRADERGGDQDQHEVEMHAQHRGGRRDEHVDVQPEEEPGAEPPQRVRAERVKGDVAQIEQPGESHHDVQAERHHRKRHGDDGRVHEAVVRREEERQHDPDHDERARQRAVPPAGEPLHHCRLQLPQPRHECAHPASLVSSPSSPRGRRTMITIR